MGPESDSKRTRYLIVGGGGFIGRALTEFFESASSSNVSWLVRSPQVVREGVEVLTLEEVRRNPDSLVEFDEVIYAAAGTVPSTSGATATREMKCNLEPLCELLGFLDKAPETGFTYLSSGGAVYDTAFGVADENTPTRPLSYYAAGKLAGEAVVRVFAEFRPGRVTVLRLSNIYGPGQPAKPGFGLIPALCRCALEGGELTLQRGGRDRRDFLYIDDFCQGVLAGIKGPGGIYNLGSGESPSVLEVIEMFQTVTGRNVPVVVRETAPSAAGDVLLDISKGRNFLDWSPQVSLRSGLRATWEWWLDQIGEMGI